MKPGSKSRSGGRQVPEAAREVGAKNKQTPNADMQAEDAGTADSGNDGQGPAAKGAMKQTSKTGSERGSR